MIIVNMYSTHLLGFLGFANVYAMRVNLSVAIVYMAEEERMGWSESQQGVILGDLPPVQISF